MNQAYQVKIDSFEGPLDLLLHLINEYKIDIYDIPVAEITEQYMNYIHTMKQLELNIASEYLVMAATLLVIKSQTLIPKQKVNEAIDEYEEDPRQELVQRLIKYRQFKEAAQHLESKEVDANHVYIRSPFIFNDLKMEQPVIKGELSIYDMIGAVHKIIERNKWSEPLDSNIKTIEIPIEQRMEEMLLIVKESKNGVLFDQLFIYPSKSHIVVTFMALLELMKDNYVYCKQKKHFENLYVFYHKT